MFRNFWANIQTVPHNPSHPTRPRLARFGMLATVFGLALCGPWAMARAAPPMRELVQAELIAEPAAIRAGEPFLVGVRLRMKPHWHTYWRNPGDSGEATSVKWTLPPGFAAGPILWPTPSRLPVAHLMNFGYEGETVLLAEMRPPAVMAAGRPVEIKADVSWLVCEKECIPGETALVLTLPAAASGAAAPPNQASRAIFDAARAALPNPAPWGARLQVGQDSLTLQIDARGLKADTIRSAYFFPFAETLVQHAAPQQLGITADGLTLRLSRNALATTAPREAGGVLLIEEALGGTTARQAFTLANVGVGQAATPPTASIAAILQAALLALAGGVILNLMPCVFPVLSIKVMGLIEHAGETRESVRRHGLAYTAGVLGAFAMLGVVLLAVRAAGAEVGWGFQLQSPVTVALLAYVLFAMGLSLSGVYHMGGSLQGIGRGLAVRSGLVGSFCTGVLAAVVATPCTAPFMATAVGFALTQPPIVALSVILALGLGLALPFLVLTLAPQLLGRLPRPGPWMETLKQLMAFPVYATVAWLVWVLAQQVGPAGLLAALVGLVLIALAAWSFNVAQTARPVARRVALGAVTASILGTGAVVAGLAQDRAGPAALSQSASAAAYEHFSQQRLAELLAGNRPVFVNMTAAWCITCLVNEHAALATASVRSAFAAKNVAQLKGDWTNRNPEITRILEKHGRSGVPLYLLYAGGPDPIVLPQILTPAIVLGEIERIGAAPQRRASLSIATKE